MPKQKVRVPRVEKLRRLRKRQVRALKELPELLECRKKQHSAQKRKQSIHAALEAGEALLAYAEHLEKRLAELTERTKNFETLQEYCLQLYRETARTNLPRVLLTNFQPCQQTLWGIQHKNDK